MVRKRLSPMTRVLLLLVRAYKVVLSPLLPSACRFYPTCSDYAAEALSRHGVLRGVYLTARRLSRCHPWGTCGCDPVPKEWGA